MIFRNFAILVHLQLIGSSLGFVPHQSYVPQTSRVQPNNFDHVRARDVWLSVASELEHSQEFSEYSESTSINPSLRYDITS